MFTRRTFIKSCVAFTGLNVAVTGSSILPFSTKQLMGIDPFFEKNEAFLLLPLALEAFHDMRNDAQKEGLLLWITSGYRTFYNQKTLWNKKITQYIQEGISIHSALEKTLIYSSVPGTSRHHWGTDMDITDALGYENTDPLNQANYEEGGEYQFLHYWLQKNAHTYGFVNVYTADVHRSGFMYEPWHYSFAPLSKAILSHVIDIDFTKIDELKQCKGFEQMDNAFFESYKKEYLLGINPLLIG